MVYSTMPRNVTFDEPVRSTAELDASRQVVVAIAGAPRQRLVERWRATVVWSHLDWV
jgi:hypothetical protein